MLPTLPMAVSCKARGRDAVQEHEHDIGLVGTLYQAAARGLLYHCSAARRVDGDIHAGHHLLPGIVLREAFGELLECLCCGRPRQLVREDVVNNTHSGAAMITWSSRSSSL